MAVLSCLLSLSFLCNVGNISSAVSSNHWWKLKEIQMLNNSGKKGIQWPAHLSTLLLWSLNWTCNEICQIQNFVCVFLKGGRDTLMEALFTHYKWNWGRRSAHHSVYCIFTEQCIWIIMREVTRKTLIRYFKCWWQVTLPEIAAHEHFSLHIVALNVFFWAVFIWAHFVL